MGRPACAARRGPRVCRGARSLRWRRAAERQPQLVGHVDHVPAGIDAPGEVPGVLDRRRDADAETELAQRKVALQAILDREGSQRGLIGDLRRMVEALEQVDDPKG